jgi:UPF0271 protein
VAPADIDLNADVGESFGTWRLGDDHALLPLVSSANVACGFHAGDPLTLRRTVAHAVANGVVIGAQVSYPDLVGFGRRAMELTHDELEADVLYQLAALDGLARVAGAGVRYVKPHGALYHRVLTDRSQAEAVVAAIIAFDAGLAVLTMPHGELAAAAEASGVTVVAEAYADRAYREDGTLVPRSEAGAVLHEPSEVAAQAVRLAADGRFRSICLHGDTPGAVALAGTVRQALTAAGMRVRPFA